MIIKYVLLSPQSYVHRSGRTARAHKDGLSVMIVDEKDIHSYRKIIKSLDKGNIQ